MKYPSPFDQSSLFPNIGLDEILEIEFHLGMLLHIPYFDDMDYLQFIWKHERLNKYIKDSAEQ
jgi:hypothetical protein